MGYINDDDAGTYTYEGKKKKDSLSNKAESIYHPSQTALPSPYIDNDPSCKQSSWQPLAGLAKPVYL